MGIIKRRFKIGNAISVAYFKSSLIFNNERIVKFGSC